MIYIILSLVCYFTLFYLWAISKKDFSVIDIAWGPSFLVIFLSSIFQEDLSTIPLREMILGVLLIIWASRLSGYILMRSIKLGKEDYRYAQWRKDWGKNANIIAYFKVYLLQAALSLLIGYPLYLMVKSPAGSEWGTPLDILGLSLWGVGFIFEAVSDYQKNKFKKSSNNQSKILKHGLWRYSRHPNYFGEAVLWWGFFFIMLNDVSALIIVWGPLLLTFMLLKVSGVALLEKKYQGNSEYQEYQRRTNAFIPWFPKEGA